MESIQKYIDGLMKTYENRVEVVASNYDEMDLQQVPEVLREFYQKYAKATFPFGCIYTIETALKQSTAEPFHKEGWFCFGQDNYFSFWLCKFEPDEENLSFTYWDHDSGCGIGGAIDKTLVELLKDVCEEWEEFEEELDDDLEE